MFDTSVDALTTSNSSKHSDFRDRNIFLPDFVVGAALVWLLIQELQFHLVSVFLSMLDICIFGIALNSVACRVSDPSKTTVSVFATSIDQIHTIVSDRVGEDDE